MSELQYRLTPKALEVFRAMQKGARLRKGMRHVGQGEHVAFFKIGSTEISERVYDIALAQIICSEPPLTVQVEGRAEDSKPWSIHDLMGTFGWELTPEAKAATIGPKGIVTLASSTVSETTETGK